MRAACLPVIDSPSLRAMVGGSPSNPPIAQAERVDQRTFHGMHDLGREVFITQRAGIRAELLERLIHVQVHSLLAAGVGLDALYTLTCGFVRGL